MVCNITVGNLDPMQVSELRNEQLCKVQSVSLIKRLTVFAHEFVEPHMSRRQFIDLAVLRCNLILFKTGQ